MEKNYATLVEACLAYAASVPEKAAVCFRKDIVTYGELARRMKIKATELVSCGVKKGDRVMLTALSKPEYIVGMLAIQYIGAVSVPVDKNAKPSSIQDIIELSDVKLFMTDTQKGEYGVYIISLKNYDERLCDKTGKVLSDGDSDGVSNDSIEVGDWNDFAMPELEDDAMLELLFTTGTTGKPKGAILTKKSIKANMCNTWHGIDMHESDVVLNPLPLNHSFGMRVLRSTLYIGATLVLQNGFAFAREIEKNIDNFGCTALVSVPASMELVLGQMQDKAEGILGKLRYIEIGAGALSQKLRKKLPEMLPHTRLHNTWGSTETGGAVFLEVTKYPDKIASIGKPLDGIDMKIIRDDDCAAGENYVGRMALKGDMQMAGYWKREDLTFESIVDGWLVTNDLVYRDSDGFIYMLGRSDDIINVGGEKVSPVEVETVASGYSGVKECACIGVSDDNGVLGQIPLLYVVAEPSYNEADLVAYLTDKLEQYKLPGKYELISELPRNAMKKLDRKALYKYYETNGQENLINPVIQNILNRRSTRRFTDRHVEDKYIEMMLEAAIHAPSGHNLQTWHFSVVRDSDKISKLKTVAEMVCKRCKVNMYGFDNPDTLILVSNDRRNPDGIQDASCAAQNIMLAANSYGIGSVWLNPLMTICDEPEIRALLDEFEVPAEHIVWATIALGYPVEVPNKLAKKKEVVSWI